jgi:large subunit ribosomal protein L21
MKDKYAIIQLGGKQFTVHEGDTFEVERQSSVKPQVLAYSNGEEIVFGTPYLKDVKVVAKAAGEKRAKRVVIQRFKAKSRHRRKQGHRQPMIVVSVEKISKEGEAVKTEKGSKSTTTNKPVQKKVKAAATAKAKKVIKEEK